MSETSREDRISWLRTQVKQTIEREPKRDYEDKDMWTWRIIDYLANQAQMRWFVSSGTARDYGKVAAMLESASFG